MGEDALAEGEQARRTPMLVTSVHAVATAASLVTAVPETIAQPAADRRVEATAG